MDYPGRYKALVLHGIQSIDLGKVSQVIQVFKAARAQGRRIFVCGNSSSDSMAAHFLCDLVKRANYNRPSPFRILALDEHMPEANDVADEITADRGFVEQLKTFAEPDDVVMGICVSGNAVKVVKAIEYAAWIGCNIITVTGRDGGRAGELADITAVRL